MERLNGEKPDVSVTLTNICGACWHDINELIVHKMNKYDTSGPYFR